MSSDNCVCVLHTSDKFEETSPGRLKNHFGKRIDAYRVAHIQAMDNYAWYKENEPHNIGYWMELNFGKTHPIYCKDEALKVAGQMMKEIDILEYGIISINASEYNFPNY